MNQPPYKRIAVASAFSPRFEMVLAEAKRVRDRLGSELSLIYVGEKDPETTRRFGEALNEIRLPRDTTIYYQQGTPAEAILAAVNDNAVELIIAGALEKEVVVRSFLGNVARRLVKEARCSVMLFTRPERQPQPLRRIVFFVPITRRTWPRRSRRRCGSPPWSSRNRSTSFAFTPHSTPRAQRCGRTRARSQPISRRRGRWKKKN
jgi:nucleotide-binding universal stress UspA family protein